jgi:hypothetical protein
VCSSSSEFYNLMSSMPTPQSVSTANVAYEAENGSREMEQMETRFRFPEFSMPMVGFQICGDLCDTGLDLGF